MNERISSVREAVKALGGTQRAAKFLRIVPSYVSNMLAANEIPRGYHWQIEQALEELGYEVDHKALFGIDRDDVVERLREAVG